ncbi:orotidine-5'-phosphate decarboxylase [Chloroflexota bacterium]
MHFLDKLLKASRDNKSLLCLGLDPDPSLMPKVSVLDFNKAIIEATADLVCAYKPNLAFYEALGPKGLEDLVKTVAFIPKGIPIIGDGKRGDIGHTAKAYARALFSAFGFDAATVNPYLGYDSLEPFLQYSEKGVFILCKTSNTGSRDFQDLPCRESAEEPVPLFEKVARKALEWNTRGNIGLVVGATYPEELKRLRTLCPEMPLLIPGIGTQGGEMARTVHDGTDAHGERAIISSSRQVLYASTGTDFALAARKEAQRLRQQINDLLTSLA